jgi:hypothetical protein
LSYQLAAADVAVATEEDVRAKESLEILLVFLLEKRIDHDDHERLG